MIKDGYRKSKNFEKYYSDIEKMYCNYLVFDKIIDFNMQFIEYYLELFDCKGKIILEY